MDKLPVLMAITAHYPFIVLSGLANMTEPAIETLTLGDLAQIIPLAWCDGQSATVEVLRA